MNSGLKGLLHTTATTASFYLTTFGGNMAWTHISLGIIVAFGLNWVISHTIPTTTGASATQ